MPEIEKEGPMRKLSILLLLAVATLGFAPRAFALSEQVDTGTNSDGSAKFTDPDDKQPFFMTGSGGGSASSQAAPFDPASTTLPAPGDRDQGAAAFDRAFSMQGNH
jgi:hypothetical protein